MLVNLQIIVTILQSDYTIMSSNSINKNPYILDLIYDKIAFTFPIRKRDRLSVINIINDPEFHSFFNRRVYGYTGGRYRNNYQFTIHKGNTIELSLYPINSHHNFLRLEYNPNKLGIKGCVKLRKFLISLLGIDRVKEIYFKASVTRLDLTLDIHNLKPYYYIHKPKVVQSSIYRDDNHIISQILGSNRSSTRVTLYDKNAEQATKGRGNALVVNNGSSTPHQRLEIRLRELNCSMAGLNGDLLQELEKINFFHKSFMRDDRFSDKFKNLVYRQGLNAVFKKVNKTNPNKAKCYRRYLEDYRATIFDVDKLDFLASHQKALGSLLHPDYKDRLN